MTWANSFAATQSGHARAVTNSNNISRRIRGVRGAINKYLGKASGDRSLEARGRRDQVRSDLGRAADKLRDAFRR